MSYLAVAMLWLCLVLKGGKVVASATHGIIQAVSVIRDTMTFTYACTHCHTRVYIMFTAVFSVLCNTLLCTVLYIWDMK